MIQSSSQCRSCFHTCLSSEDRDNENKIMLLPYLDKGFLLDKNSLIRIQHTCSKFSSLINKCQSNSGNDLSFYKSSLNGNEKRVICLPENISSLVLNYMYSSRNMHLGPNNFLWCSSLIFTVIILPS